MEYQQCISVISIPSHDLKKYFLILSCVYIYVPECMCGHSMCIEALGNPKHQIPRNWAYG